MSEVDGSNLRAVNIGESYFFTFRDKVTKAIHTVVCNNALNTYFDLYIVERFVPVGQVKRRGIAGF